MSRPIRASNLEIHTASVGAAAPAQRPCMRQAPRGQVPRALKAEVLRKRRHTSFYGSPREGGIHSGWSRPVNTCDHRADMCSVVAHGISRHTGVTIGISGVATMIGAAAWSAVAVWNASPPNYGLISTSVPPAPPTIRLTPNDQGYVRVETRSGSTSCSITTELVACQTSADHWPSRPDGRPYRAASINANGEFNWVVADLGALKGRVLLDYQTYSAQSWTIDATPDGTKYTNDRTRHGMSVNDQRVTPF